MVADAAPERAQALAARYGARAVTVSEAIHSDAIDAVLIASSTPSHAELLEAAARAGKAVYCEKPIDLSLARAREVVDALSQRFTVAESEAAHVDEDMVFKLPRELVE